jgi:methionine-S-sulfoxide reductase
MTLFAFLVSTLAMANDSSPKFEQATFAGGCFWCMETPFTNIEGVIEVLSGYTGGHKDKPTYEEVSAGGTGHVEAVQVTFNPKKISYEKLLDAFWRSHDPTDPDGQFADRGDQYRSAIFYHSPEQKRLAESSKGQLENSHRFPKKVITAILPFTKFYPAEQYHQHYCKKNSNAYEIYRRGSGRDAFIEKYWGKASKKIVR